MCLSRAYEKVKTPTLQLTFSNGADTKSCVFQKTNYVRWIINLTELSSALCTQSMLGS